MSEHMERLKKMDAFWEYAGFSSWQGHGMEGVYRRVTFVKDGFIGKVAEFFTDDYIVWTHQGIKDEERILRQWKAETDVMKHRFLLLSTESAAGSETIALRRRCRSRGIRNIGQHRRSIGYRPKHRCLL